MLTRRTLLLAKIEDTYGIDSTPVVGTDAILHGALNLKHNGQILTRDYYRSNLSPLEHVMGQEHVELTFETEIKGAGAAYSASVKPEIAPLLRGASFSETIDTAPGTENIIYAPVSTGLESLTIWVYLEGMIFKLVGCLGNAVINAEAGQYGKINWTFRGKISSIADLSFATGTFDSVKPPVCESVGLTIGGYASATYTRFNGSLNNVIALIGDMNSTDSVWGFKITNRDSNGGIDPLAQTEATRTWWANFRAATAEALTLTIGATQYNKCTIAALKAQAMSIGIGDREGERVWDIPLRFAGSSGDDELTLLYN